MENAWQLFLRQLSADPEFTYDDVCGWSTDEFEALTGAGLISEMAQATHVSCELAPKRIGSECGGARMATGRSFRVLWPGTGC